MTDTPSHDPPAPRPEQAAAGQPFSGDLSKASDDDLVHLAASGDDDAFEELYRRYRAAWLRFAQRLVGEAQAEDIVSTAATKMYCLVARVHSHFRGWSYRVLSSVAVDHLRKKLRRPEDPTDPTTEAFLHAAGQGRELDPEDLADLRNILADAIGLLSADDQLIILARFWGDRSHAELAEMLAITESASQRRLFRAMDRLRHVLRQMGVVSEEDTQRRNKRRRGQVADGEADPTDLGADDDR